MDNHVEVIAKYISVWNWQVLGLIFLNTLVILVAMETSTKTIVLSVAMFICAAYSLFISYKRRKELQNE